VDRSFVDRRFVDRRFVDRRTWHFELQQGFKSDSFRLEDVKKSILKFAVDSA
jgi:hypothetical protein